MFKIKLYKEVSNCVEYNVINIFGIKFKFKKRGTNSSIFHNNEVYIDNKRVFTLDKINGIKLEIIGKNNIIKIMKPKGNGTLLIKMLEADDCYVEINKENVINNGTLTILAVNQPGKKVKGSCVIGENNVFNGNFKITIPLDKDKSVKIGSNNLFAQGIEIKGCAEHLIYDINSKEKYNLELGVEIGNKIWIGSDVLLLNKAKISDGSVVASRCVITKKFNDENVLIAGVPGKIKRTNISWHRCLDDSYLESL